jgi:hypothetical protein
MTTPPDFERINHRSRSVHEMPVEFRHIDFAMPGQRKQERSPWVFFILFALALFLMLAFTGVNI